MRSVQWAGQPQPVHQRPPGVALHLPLTQRWPDPQMRLASHGGSHWVVPLARTPGCGANKGKRQGPGISCGAPATCPFCMHSQYAPTTCGHNHAPLESRHTHTHTQPTHPLTMGPSPHIHAYPPAYPPACRPACIRIRLPARQSTNRTTNPPPTPYPLT